ncbi:MAG TPA: uroporphyrinogen decarboxylase family protein, partial [Thermodesulfovibrionales bacterium]|nr:uroporphyrinogen decarboxylase family protein [Thermodesulfovibrionales bacterium]
KAFELGKPERVPVTLFGGGMWSIKDYGTTFEELSKNVDKNVDMCVAEAEKIRSDVVYVGSGFNNFHAIALGRKFGAGVKFREIGAPDMTEHFVHSEEDIAKLDIQDLFKEDVIKGVMDATLKVKEKIGNKYLVTMTCWGPFTLAARFVGEEAFMKATFKKPAFVEKMVDFCADLLIALYEPLVDKGLEALSIADPTASGDLINPKQMSRFAVPPLKKMSDWAKSKGVYTILHICGNTSDRLEQFIDTGCTVIFFDQKVDIAKAKEVLFGKMCFGGNVAPVHVLLNKTKEEVEQACKETIELAGKDGGYVLVPGCDIPPTISYENLKAFHDVALNWKY